MTERLYLLDTAEESEMRRLAAQTELWDPHTFQKFNDIGVTKGWSCLEIGAGTGSVVRWLCDRVGDAGRVVATDIETRWLEAISLDNLEARNHDITADPLEESEFDLVHVRLVLMHLPQREVIIEKLIRALKPGGRLVIEDYDLRQSTFIDPPNPLWPKVSNAITHVMQAGGVDISFGARLRGLLRSAGLSQVTAEGHLHLLPADHIQSIYTALILRLRDAALHAGLVTEDEFAQGLALLADSDQGISFSSPTLISAIGQRA